MEKRDKIIIGALIVVIIALVACLAFMFAGNNVLNDGTSVPDGMKMYNFNSEFKMAVPENAKFLKTWGDSQGANLGTGYTYFDKHNKISVNFIDSPLVNSGFVEEFANAANSSDNATIEKVGDMFISHNKKNGKMASTQENSNFTESIVIQKGHLLIGILGNDLDLIKSMANTIEYCE